MSEKKNDFEEGQLPTEEEIKVPEGTPKPEVEQPKPEAQSGDVSLDDMDNSHDWVNTPKVGEVSEELIMQDIKATQDQNLLIKELQNDTIDNRLEIVKGQKKYGYYIVTNKGWMWIKTAEVYYKLMSMKKQLGLKGFRDCNITFKLAHINDGLIDKERKFFGKYYQLLIVKDGKWFEVTSTKKDGKYVMDLIEVKE